MHHAIDPTKQAVLTELDSRIDRLKAHQDDHSIESDNQYEALNHALAKAIGVPLQKELEDLRCFVEHLS